MTMFGKLKKHFRSLLYWSEQRMKTDVPYLAKGVSWLSLGYGFAMFSGLFMSIAFANLFSKESFGTYKFILSVVGIIGTFSLTGLGTAVTQAVARGFGNSLRQGFRINLKWSFGVLVGGLITSIYYYTQGNAILSLSFLIAGLTTPITVSANLYGAYLVGKKDFKRSSLYGIAQNMVPVIFIITTLFFTDSLLIIITAYFLSISVTPLFLYLKTLRAHQSENKKEDHGLLSYGKHLSIMEIIARVAGQLDKILIFHFLGATSLATYAFATAPVEQLQAGKKILSTLVKPKLAARPFHELQKSLPARTFWLIVYALCLAGIYALFAPYIYKFIFPQYSDSVFYSQIYSLTLLAIGSTLFQDALMAHQKTKELYFLRTIIPIMQLILFIILLPLYGIMGLIVTHVIMRSMSGLIAYYLVKCPFKTAFSN